MKAIRIEQIIKSNSNGIRFYIPISTKRKALGYSLIIIGLATYIIPFTTIPMIALGCFILNIKLNDAKDKIEKLKLRLKYRK